MGWYIFFSDFVNLLVKVVKGDPKAPFSIATRPRCGEGHCSFPWIAPFCPWYVLYYAEC